MRWFTKLTFVYADFIKFYGRLGSPTFSVLLSGTVEVECVPNPPQQQKHLIVTSDDIVDLFRTTGRTVDEARMAAIGMLLEDRNAGACMSKSSSPCASLKWQRTARAECKDVLNKQTSSPTMATSALRSIVSLCAWLNDKCSRKVA